MTIDSADDSNGPSIRIESRIGRTIWNRIESNHEASQVPSQIVLVRLAKSSTLVGQRLQNTGRCRWSMYVGRRRSQESDEWSRREWTSDPSWQSFAKYNGAGPFRHR